MTRKIMELLCNLLGARVLEPNTAYLAVSSTIPQLGEPYKCYRLETIDNIILRELITSPVKSIDTLDENIFSVKTDNSYYITRIIGKTERQTYFAFINNYPHIGQVLNCKKIDFTSTILTSVDCKASIVKSVTYKKGLYYVETLDSLYICIAMKN